jgi:uncharacterized protein with von Willebrand factor type A (vWA) domain
MKPTRFAARDDGPAARVAGFMAHLRLNGFQLGVAETELALAALTQVQSSMADEARLALQCVCAGSADQAARFPSLFDAYWRNGGRVREKAVPQPSQSQPTDRMKNSRSADVPGTAAAAGGRIDAPDDGGDDEVEMGGEGKRVASRLANLMKKDLRDLVSPQDIWGQPCGIDGRGGARRRAVAKASTFAARSVRLCPLGVSRFDCTEKFDQNARFGL